MLDDLIGQIVGEAAFGRLNPSRRTQLLVRLFFGLLGASLCIVGALHVLLYPRTSNALLTSMMTLLFAALAAFFLCNVAMARRWKWPGLACIAAFVSMFVVRIATGP